MQPKIFTAFKRIMNSITHCGYAAIIGRPNVGKSTLLNQLIGQKISITSRKPQTTRHRILGIKTLDQDQIIFVDTPGLHHDPKHLINRVMIQTALEAIKDVDVIIFVVDARYWHEEDDYILKKLGSSPCPVIIALNKIDQMKDKDDLLPIIENIQKKCQEHNFEPLAIIPVSAKKGLNIEPIDKTILPLLPEGPHLFADDDVTDKDMRFIAAELIREKLMRLLGQEVPHSLTVEIEEFQVKNNVLHIGAIIWVERPGQKIIVIGQKGEKLKEVGQKARLELEQQLEKKVFLRLWVKVKKGWMDDARALHTLGYHE
jgi:GTP-binding protein Era